MSQQPAPSASDVSNDARPMMVFEANKKSLFVAYLLWFFLGGIGAHRFYNGKTGSGVAQLLMLVGGVILSFVVVGFFVLAALGIWVLVDAFLIPGWIRDENSRLAAQLADA
jgi:TM2 domain-containing membrane protein YozV